MTRTEIEALLEAKARDLMAFAHEKEGNSAYARRLRSGRKEVFGTNEYGAIMGGSAVIVALIAQGHLPVDFLTRGAA